MHHSERTAHWALEETIHTQNLRWEVLMEKALAECRAHQARQEQLRRQARRRSYIIGTLLALGAITIITLSYGALHGG